MSNTGKKLFRCADCKNAWMERPIRLTRAARLRCPACGSIAVDISNLGRKDVRARGDAARLSASTGHYAVHGDSFGARE